MQYICNDCNHIFSVPEVERRDFDHAFGTERVVQQVCPECGGDFEVADTCRNRKCSEAMHRGDILCADCRTDLKHRLIAFFDTLTAEEEAQFDLWMDGNSITDRKKWEV